VLGVAKPAALEHTVSWGIIEETRIGYVYVSTWGGDAGERFEQAIRELTRPMGADHRLPAQPRGRARLRFMAHAWPRSAAELERRQVERPS
jgi:hypothetical protein